MSNLFLLTLLFFIVIIHDSLRYVNRTVLIGQMRKREKRSKSCSQCMLLDDSLRLIGYEELATVMESIG